MPHFEVFKKRLAPLKSAPYVTLQMRGILSMNKSAHAALGSPGAVELLYDPEERIIGIRSIDASAEHAYVVRNPTSSSTSTYLVSARAFAHYWGIDISVSRRWPAVLMDDVLCIDIKQPGTQVNNERRGAKPVRREEEASGGVGPV